MTTQYRCKNERRRTAVRDRPRVNGIDYLEVAADPQTLMVYFIHPLVDTDATARVPADQPPLNADNILITGGVRRQGVTVESISAFANVLMVRVSQVGDFSPYTLRLVQSAANPLPPAGFDPQLASVTFSFWAEGISEFDCDAAAPLPDTPDAPPVIDYLAKDYASFRRLMLDRLAVTLPQWRERNPSDIGVMLVELMAYAADHLSYFQDAIATEAYLNTARRRVSVRRHVRLLDYFMHEGCNARAWVVVQLRDLSDRQTQTLDGLTLLGANPTLQRPGVQLLSRTVLPNGFLTDEQVSTGLRAGAQVFETLEDLTLYPALDTLEFYTWDDEQCSLPKGSTQATLCDPTQRLKKQLKVGRVLVFEEVKGRISGHESDADRQRRHAVRLMRVQPTTDPLHDRPIVDITWATADALPFDLAISGLDPDGNPIACISVARGNVVLADAGRTVPPENLREAAGWAGRLRPRLQEHPLTQQGRVPAAKEQWVPFDPTTPAVAAMQWQLRDARPAIALWENQVPQAGSPGAQWQPQPDLLNSDRFARDFVVEVEEDGRAYLRFGDGQLGKRPAPTQDLYAVYRIGNGQAGNVGADTLVNWVLRPENLEPDARPFLGELIEAIACVTNPLPAVGGTEPESLEQVRLYAPQAFREQRRAVTTDDYGAIASKFPGVQKALATRRWTGSWHTLFITVDREDGRPVDEAFKQELLTYLEEFRLAGHDIEIENPRFVPLDLAMTVRVAADYFRSAVQRSLLDAFSRSTVEGRQGFFNPNEFTFGQPIYLSRVVATAMQVAGVQSVRVTRFRRWGEADAQELDAGVIRLDRLEIARLDNTPSAPENGRIDFHLEGGL
ncbi:MAG: putative baseplate assembly protein [Synechococcales bacterium]|nr:putative baseplate assembly protein [Synechococcales bacterium]